MNDPLTQSDVDILAALVANGVRKHQKGLRSLEAKGASHAAEAQKVRERILKFQQLLFKLKSMEIVKGRENAKLAETDPKSAWEKFLDNDPLSRSLEREP